MKIKTLIDFLLYFIIGLSLVVFVVQLIGITYRSRGSTCTAKKYHPDDKY